MSERSRNLASVFDALLSHDIATRGDLVAASALSKATVSRLVDDLAAQGLVVPADLAPHASKRGRRPEGLTIPRSLGHVIGVSLGLQSTGVLATDIVGRELAWATEATPIWDSRAAAVSWLATRIDAASRASGSPLREVAVAVPSRVLRGIEISRPPLSFGPLAGTDFALELAAAVGAPVTLDSDANMALAGLTMEGVVPETVGPVLLNMSTVLTVAMRRRDGSIARGFSSAFGDFSLLPFHDPTADSTLGALLSTHGLEGYASLRGVALGHIDELWTRLEPQADGIRSTFAAALVAALRVVAVMADPPVVVLAGRLVPLVELVLPAVTTQLSEQLADPPRIITADPSARGHSTSAGAALVARRAVQRSISSTIEADERPPAVMPTD